LTATTILPHKRLIQNRQQFLDTNANTKYKLNCESILCPAASSKAFHLVMARQLLLDLLYKTLLLWLLIGSMGPVSLMSCSSSMAVRTHPYPMRGSSRGSRSSMSAITLMRGSSSGS
jgi:hypothetical protein